MGFPYEWLSNVRKMAASSLLEDVLQVECILQTLPVPCKDRNRNSGWRLHRPDPIGQAWVETLQTVKQTVLVGAQRCVLAFG